MSMSSCNLNVQYYLIFSLAILTAETEKLFENMTYGGVSGYTAGTIEFCALKICELVPGHRRL
ncbi:hypothetical protein CPB86DRAFT_568236 [Serendipita vermifera]|nr:hypothetical protein CPB86DRAFT_568236 [Serendipita vermifera]